MKKTTQLMEELNGSDDINSFLSNNKDSLDRQDFASYLCELLKKKKMTKIEVIRISQLNQIYGYQIFAGARLPSKDKIIAIALAMKLDVDTVQRLLTLAGEAQLYPKNPRVCI
ncbi:helix-turn-helix domain-containing protein, partial [Ruminococcus bicirculans (ex Wegman et al. 2014)]|uniref:helix-turn-helix domain-containing protein n=1 Tax=Ruminococcus bicirculans (ex Wegman et al. 2014) TaxID=1160721 RepID=UPI003FD8FCA7